MLVDSQVLKIIHKAWTDDKAYSSDKNLAMKIASCKVVFFFLK